MASQNSEFPKFDIVSDVSDHYYAATKSPSLPKGNPTTNGVHKKIMQEWKILDKDLPDSIFVRVYETRVDLLRAAIVGAWGTPYHDGLFFFDLCFPSDYPARPPSVYYRSFGYRLNPNLYSNGRVCLSLLNTWTGKKTEKWDPKQSTILQIKIAQFNSGTSIICGVTGNDTSYAAMHLGSIWKQPLYMEVLLSIQALVLNEKPFFNEPGYSMMPGRSYWDKKSAAYNDDVFILNCKTMLCVLRKPPKNFETLVTHHFTTRAQFILTACNAYKTGLSEIGYFEATSTRRATSKTRREKIEVTKRFKGAMEQAFGDLVREMEKIGAPISGFVEQVEEEREIKESEKEMKKKMKKKMREKMVDAVVKRLKKVLGVVGMGERGKKKMKEEDEKTEREREIDAYEKYQTSFVVPIPPSLSLNPSTVV